MTLAAVVNLLESDCRIIPAVEVNGSLPEDKRRTIRLAALWERFI
jgi:hypothetical protein